MNTYKPLYGIIFYCIIAIVLSGIFRPGFFDFYNQGQYNIFVTLVFVVFLVGWGPAIAAFLSWKLFGRQNRISSLFGTWRNGAILMSLIPAGVFAFFGYPNEQGINPHLAGAILGALIFLYALGEEIGWRGYMHDALSPRPIWLRAVIISIVWWAWHLWFLQDGTSPGILLIGYGIILVSALIFSWIISESKSWISAASFHSIGNIGFMAAVIDLPNDERLKIAGISLALLIVVHHFWKQRVKQVLV